MEGGHPKPSRAPPTSPCLGSPRLSGAASPGAAPRGAGAEHPSTAPQGSLALNHLQAGQGWEKHPSKQATGPEKTIRMPQILPVCNLCEGATAEPCAHGCQHPLPALPELRERLSPCGDAAAESSSSPNPVAMRSPLRHLVFSGSADQTASPEAGREKRERAKRWRAGRGAELLPAPPMEAGGTGGHGPAGEELAAKVLPGVGDGCVLSRQGGRGRLLAGWGRAVCQMSPCWGGV